MNFGAPHENPTMCGIPSIPSESVLASDAFFCAEPFGKSSSTTGEVAEACVTVSCSALTASSCSTPFVSFFSFLCSVGNESEPMAGAVLVATVWRLMYGRGSAGTTGFEARLPAAGFRDFVELIIGAIMREYGVPTGFLQRQSVDVRRERRASSTRNPKVRARGRKRRRRFLQTPGRQTPGLKI